MTDANYWDPVLNRSYHAFGRTEAAALGLAIGTYVDRLLDAREHPEQAVRAWTTS
jgi:hypothetical protein